MDRFNDILDFWFEGIDEDTVITKDSEFVKRWFGKDKKVDEAIRQNFKEDLASAQRGEYGEWKKTPAGRLALIILFDQFPRHLYRETARAFENDLQALELCLRSIKDHFDEGLIFVERQFLYMPLMHSENMAIQEESLKYFGRLVKEAEETSDPNVDYLKYVLGYAQRHYDIVKRFGRFPHRNAMLKRRATSHELEFVKKPEANF